MAAGVVRTNGLDGVGGMAFESSRRKIEREDIAFANANKHRLGWQTIAKIRAVNMDDLRRHCDQGYALVEPAVAAPVTPKGSVAASPIRALPPREFALAMKVLWTVAAGAAGTLDISDACSISRGSAAQYVFRLKLEGLMAGHGPTGWVITAAGADALRRAAR